MIEVIAEEAQCAPHLFRNEINLDHRGREIQIEETAVS